MHRRLNSALTAVRRMLSGDEQGIADLLLVAMFAFILAVILTGHRIVVQ